MTLLGFHLKQNLWVGADYDQIVLEDDIGSALKAAMAVRRECLPGTHTPLGILTRLSGAPAAGLLAQIESNPAAADLSLLLHQLSEVSLTTFGDGFTQIVAAARRDLGRNDFGMKVADTGLTDHATRAPEEEAREFIHAHCAQKKHQQRAQVWHGLLIEPAKSAVRAAPKLDHAWEVDANLDAAAVCFGQGRP
jgi:hypothetical protein